jgi:hypothetical protein
LRPKEPPQGHAMIASSAAPKPRGNPNLHLAPRCGARTRGGCPCRAPAIHGRARCRMHGGRSTGPRTPEGLARLRAAHTTHGNHAAPALLETLHIRIITARIRALCDATALRPWLPPALTARLEAGRATELGAPPDPAWGEPPYDGGTGSRAALRAAARAEAAALAPWRAAIAAAREARRAEKAQGPHAPEPGAGGFLNSAPRAPAPERADPARGDSRQTAHATERGADAGQGRLAPDAGRPGPGARRKDRVGGAGAGTPSRSPLRAAAQTPLAPEDVSGLRNSAPRPHAPGRARETPGVFRQTAHASETAVGAFPKPGQTAHAPERPVREPPPSAQIVQRAHAPVPAGTPPAPARPLNRKERRRLKWLARQARRAPSGTAR